MAWQNDERAGQRKPEVPWIDRVPAALNVDRTAGKAPGPRGRPGTSHIPESITANRDTDPRGGAGRYPFCGEQDGEPTQATAYRYLGVGKGEQHPQKR